MAFNTLAKRAHFPQVSVQQILQWAKEKPNVKQQNRFIFIFYFEKLEVREERRKNHILTLAKSERSSYGIPYFEDELLQ